MVDSEKNDFSDDQMCDFVGCKQPFSFIGRNVCVTCGATVCAEHSVDGKIVDGNKARKLCLSCGYIENGVLSKESHNLSNLRILEEVLNGEHNLESGSSSETSTPATQTNAHPSNLESPESHRFGGFFNPGMFITPRPTASPNSHIFTCGDVVNSDEGAAIAFSNGIAERAANVNDLSRNESLWSQDSNQSCEEEDHRRYSLNVHLGPPTKSGGTTPASGGTASNWLSQGKPAGSLKVHITDIQNDSVILVDESFGTMANNLKRMLDISALSEDAGDNSPTPSKESGDCLNISDIALTSPCSASESETAAQQSAFDSLDLTPVKPDQIPDNTTPVSTNQVKVSAAGSLFPAVDGVVDDAPEAESEPEVARQFSHSLDMRDIYSQDFPVIPEFPTDDGLRLGDDGEDFQYPYPESGPVRSQSFSNPISAKSSFSLKTSNTSNEFSNNATDKNAKAAEEQTLDSIYQGRSGSPTAEVVEYSAELHKKRLSFRSVKQVSAPPPDSIDLVSIYESRSAPNTSFVNDMRRASLARKTAAEARLSEDIGDISDIYGGAASSSAAEANGTTTLSAESSIGGGQYGSPIESFSNSMPENILRRASFRQSKKAVQLEETPATHTNNSAQISNGQQNSSSTEEKRAGGDADEAPLQRDPSVLVDLGEIYGEYDSSDEPMQDTNIYSRLSVPASDTIKNCKTNHKTESNTSNRTEERFSAPQTPDLQVDDIYQYASPEFSGHPHQQTQQLSARSSLLQSAVRNLHNSQLKEEQSAAEPVEPSSSAEPSSASTRSPCTQLLPQIPGMSKVVAVEDEEIIIYSPREKMRDRMRKTAPALPRQKSISPVPSLSIIITPYSCSEALLASSSSEESTPLSTPRVQPVVRRLSVTKVPFSQESADSSASKQFGGDQGDADQQSYDPHCDDEDYWSTDQIEGDRGRDGEPGADEISETSSIASIATEVIDSPVVSAAPHTQQQAQSGSTNQQSAEEYTEVETSPIATSNNSNHATNASRYSRTSSVPELSEAEIQWLFEQLEQQRRHKREERSCERLGEDTQSFFSAVFCGLF